MPGDFSFKDCFKKGNDRCSSDTYYVHTLHWACITVGYITFSGQAKEEEGDQEEEEVRINLPPLLSIT